MVDGTEFSVWGVKNPHWLAWRWCSRPDCETNPLRPGLAKLFEVACPNYLQISKKLFNVPSRILKSGRSWSLPVIIINYCVIIIIIIINNAQYNYYISNKRLLEECDKEENLVVRGGCCCFLLEKNIPVEKRNDPKYFVITKRKLL
jgi:hypothetical protein